MHNVWLIARREYIERIRTRGFMITTIMIPLIMAGFIFGTIFLGSRSNPDTHLAVVSSDTQLALDLQSELEHQTEPISTSILATRQPHLIVDAMDVGPDTRSIVDGEIDSGDLDGYLWIA